MGAITSQFARKDPRKPVKGLRPRFKNIALIHFRGIFGCLVPIILLAWQPEKGKHDITVRCLWIWMFWFFLLQPVNIPVTGFIPMFLLPMAGVMSTVDTCKCYFNDNIGLHILAGMLHLLVNGCGLDRRIILSLLCSGDACQFSGKRMVLKASTAAFFLSIISNRLIVTSTITQFLTPAYLNLQSATARYRKTEPDYDNMRYIVLNAVQTASAIGSTAILHAALTTVTMRAIWSTNPGNNAEYPDIFNYLQYTCFAFPMAFTMFLFNFLYHMLLINSVIGKPMSGNSMTEMRNMLLNHKNALPPEQSYEKVCLFFYMAFLAVCFFRWSDWLDMGWSSFRTVIPEIPLIKDATVAAMFVVGLHVLPRSITFWKYLTAKNRTELGVLKPESAILWWRFVDKNTIYGYIILIGGGVALNSAIRISSLNNLVTSEYGHSITNLSWNTSIFVVCLISIILANIMSGVAACCIFLPFVLNMALETAGGNWPKNVYLGAVAVGIGTSMGFMSPFLYTPAYFCHYTGKVPIKRMIKYSIGSAIICCVTLWLALCFWGPFIWDSEKGITIYTFGQEAETTTAAAEPPEG
ncbi:protein I'm not dead yet-like [Vanessa atalanta]|uniref:protein I'm not dead yet-like n=1 Tax=Vanessa atalanta TaxID=42275 RepID=UPI001FCD27CC|nr:protein I'm not dead yet-like [Vanessa atalanta]